MTTTARFLRLAAAWTGVAALAACTVGPDYQKPSAPTPDSYKEIDGWKPAKPALAASGEA